MKSWLTIPYRVIAFAVWFAFQILMSSWAVLADILTPGLNGTPRVVRMPLESQSDFHVAAIGVLITLTPGTLTLGVVGDQTNPRCLLVHSMYHPGTAEALDDLQEMERRMLRALTIGGGR